ncbi:DNA primase [Streptomyces sp. SID13726]|uniref:DNA primase n=1 Tax=Streptomyces sp. SID13726 TaxID=2706058 RepID=UPI0013B8C702|nr:DNA primase [Streptomyces sp. SID13726]NEB05455.1 DNA primase [Streptomyces sp. SID13726]
MNRVGLGLAVGAGYLLGRTKKLKLAFAVGTLVAGKRMHLSPRAIADLVSQQLLKNPQFKEIGDQLRVDLRGVGKAASGAMVERQIDAIADRLHGRTAEVRDQLAGVAPDVPGLFEDEDEESEGDEESERGQTGTTDADDERSDRHDGEAGDERNDRDDRGDRGERNDRDGRPAAAKKAAKKAPAKKAAAKKAPGGKPPARQTAQSRTAGKKTAAKKTATKKTAAKKATAAGGAARGARARLPKGGGE